MKVSPDVEYKELRTHLRFLNDKINEAFSLFIKLATAIIGGEFFLHASQCPSLYSTLCLRGIATEKP
jgi:hypothetical protein